MLIFNNFIAILFMHTRAAYETKLSYRVALPLLLGLTASLGVWITVWYMFTSPLPDAALALVPLAFFSVLWSTMVWGELRIKAVRIRSYDTYIECTHFMGFGKKTTFAGSRLQGVKTSLLPAFPRPWEERMVTGASNELFKQSGFYHQNYGQVKQMLCSRWADHGYKKFDLKESVRAIFTT